MLVWVWLGLLLPALVSGLQISDELYFRAPPLYHLDDYERCLFLGGTFCLGEFQLRPQGNVSLFQELQEISSHRYLPNRTLLHRGLCLTSSEEDPTTLFQQMVDRDMAENYGLRARIKRLNYCKSKDAPGTRPIDYTDVLMAAVILSILVLNVAGTVYDLKRNPEEKHINRFLMAWSLRNNWNRLTAHHHGDEKLDALAVIHGIKAHQGLLVVAAHTMLALVVVYLKDTRYVDDIITRPEAILAKNGTIVVQTFSTLSCFLLAYMLLLHVDKTKKILPLSKAPAIILNRYIRMTPTVMFMVGVTATWVARSGDGPMWWHMEQLEADCRAKWWTHLFFLNNIINPDQRCTVQTWFLAVDMQLFLVAVVLTLLLLPNPRRAPRILLSLYAAVVATNLALNVKWQMVPMVSMTTVDNMRNLCVELESYNWYYLMPWISFPACLHGLILAFVHYNLQQDGFKPAEHKWPHVATKCAYAGLLAAIFSGMLVEKVSSPLALSIIATFDRVVFNALVTFILWALINKVDGTVRDYLTWRGFHIASRIALSVALVHWHINLGGPAAQSQMFELTIYNYVVQCISGLALSYMLALPLHLMVELPTQKLIDIIM